MLPDIRFAIGAILLSTLLIVSALGLAATVRIAHYRAVGPLEASRVLAYADPADWSSGPRHNRRVDNAGSDATGGMSLLDRIAAIPLDPDAPRLTRGPRIHTPPGEPGLSEPQPAEPARSAGEQVAAAPITAEEKATAEPQSELSQDSATVKQADPETKKKVAKKRRRPAPAKVTPPTAKTGYPVTDSDNNSEFMLFRN